MTDRRIETPGGISIGLAEWGQGEPLVFVHGTGASASRWQSVAHHFLTSGRRVLEYDRRGRGKSTDSTSYSLADETADLAAIIEHAGQGRPVDVVAHSFGALIALALVSEHPHLFRHLVLYEAPVSIPGQCHFIDETRVAELERLRQRDGNESATLFFLRHFPKATKQDIAELKRMDTWRERTSAAPTLARELMAAHDFTPDFDKLRGCHVPCLILLGELSVPPFQISARTFKDVLPCSILETIPGERHRAMDNNPDLVAGLIERFLGIAQPEN